MATPAAKQIKEVEQLFKKANELDGIDPRMAYHVRYYGVLKGISAIFIMIFWIVFP
tara:strand:- start:691 stop:858 length:168 start_codon:yes stop_codon:yes gene_type:complete